MRFALALTLLAIMAQTRADAGMVRYQCAAYTINPGLLNLPDKRRPVETARFSVSRGWLGTGVPDEANAQGHFNIAQLTNRTLDCAVGGRTISFGISDYQSSQLGERYRARLLIDGTEVWVGAPWTAEMDQFAEPDLPFLGTIFVSDRWVEVCRERSQDAESYLPPAERGVAPGASPTPEPPPRYAQAPFLRGEGIAFVRTACETFSIVLPGEQVWGREQ